VSRIKKLKKAAHLSISVAALHKILPEIYTFSSPYPIRTPYPKY